MLIVEIPLQLWNFGLRFAVLFLYFAVPLCGVCSAAAKNRDENANAVDCIPVIQAAEMRCLLEMLLGRHIRGGGLT